MLVYTTWAPALPCSWDVDTSCCGDWNTFSPTLQTAAAEAGALVLWAATGRRFGVCQRTIRPCGRECRRNGVYGYFWSEGTWLPYIFNGAWRNCWCGNNGDGCCTCAPTCQVYLPGPVNSIPATGISQDGAIVPVDAWRVDDGKWLVRTDGSCWPECQDFDADSGTNTFFVTYNQGLAVPAPLLAAAGQYACEWAKACLGSACQLPQRATSIARQGVTMSMVNVDDLLKRGLTGIVSVDQVIMSINPYGLKSPMRVATPDGPQLRETTIP